jgi:predicted DsbA family dithiol-disulfide isomerase
VQGAVVEALFRAYFLEGRDIGDAEMLGEIAAVAGMDREETLARLESGSDREAVQAEIEAAQRIGVTGVPTFVLAGRYGLVGAQPPDELAAAFRSVAARLAEGPVAAQ